MSGELRIKILQKKDNSTVNLKLKDNISVEIGNIKEVKITNTTLCLQEGKTNIEEIRQILGISVLTVINESSAIAISSISCGGVSKEETLVKGEELEIEYGEAVEDFLNFKIKTEIAEFIVKTDKKIKVDEATRETFTITDETSVTFPAYQLSLKVKDVLDFSLVTIRNESRTDITGVTYAGINLDTVQKKSSVQRYLVNFSQIPDHIHFNIYNAKNGKNIEIKTVEKFSISKKETKTFTITDATMVLSEDGVTSSSLKALLGVGSLKIINQSSVEILDVKYSGNKISEILSKNAMGEIEFEEAVEAYLEFIIKNRDKSFKLKTSEKINIATGEEKIFNITDGTLISLPQHQFPVSIKNVLDFSLITIRNESRADITGVTYAGVDLGVVQKKGSVESVFCSFDKTPEHIIFSVFQIATGKTVTAKTKVKFSVGRKENKIFTLADDTEAIEDGTSKTVSIKNLLGFGSFKLENKTSVSSIRNVNYANYVIDSLDESKTWELDKSVDDFIYFEIATSRTTFKVKTHKKIKTDLGEEKTFAITDESLVIPLNETKAVSIGALLDAAVIQIFNKTAVNALTDVLYCDVNFGTVQTNKKMNLIDFGKVPSYIYFSIYNATSGKKVSVRTVEKFSASKKEVKRFYIKNETEVVIEETNETTSIRKILGIGCLKIINQSTAKSISKIKFLGAVYEDALPQGFACYFEFTATVNDCLYFVLENELGAYDVKTKDKISLVSGEEKTFILTDDTLIVIGNTPPAKISSLIYAACLEVTNASSTELLNVTYNNPENYNFGSLSINEVNSVDYWDYANGQYPISFEIKTQSGNIIKVKTNETKALLSKQTVSFVITDTTPVIIEATGKTSSIQKILGIACLKFINQSTALVADVRFAGAKFSGQLQQGNHCEFKVAGTTEDYIYFFIWSAALNVKMKDNINIIAGENKDFNLTNDTLVVILETGEIATIRDILNR